METAIENEVRNRAHHQCEYCRLSERFSKLKFVLDHVIARQHGGADSPDNLALACGFCNRHKGPNIAGIDPLTNQLARLYHPRQDRWPEHFRWEGAELAGLTMIGGATINVLKINHALQIAIRQTLIDEAVFPPAWED
jgi:hypothetical protein